MKYKINKPILLVLLFFSSTMIIKAQIPSPGKVLSMAVYDALNNSNQNIPDNAVNYNITGPAIATMLGGIEADTVLDCSGMQALNTAYLYVKYSDGTRNIYSIYLKWSHISLSSRETCFYIQPAAQSLLEAAVQP